MKHGMKWCDLIEALLNLFVESAANDQATYSELLFIIIMGGGWRFGITGLLAPRLTAG